MSTLSKHTQRLRSALLTGCFSAAALCLLVACGGSGSGNSGGTSDHVASIGGPGKGGGPSASPSSSDAGRPHLRMDSSDAEVLRLDSIWWDCLHEHGVPGGHKPGAGDIWYIGGKRTDYPAAYQACQSKEPVIPWQEDESRNPHYGDDFRASIKCQRDAGLMVHALPNYGEDYDSSAVHLSTTQENRIVKRCILQSFK